MPDQHGNSWRQKVHWNVGTDNFHLQLYVLAVVYLRNYVGLPHLTIIYILDKTKAFKENELKQTYMYRYFVVN